jgi:hypothetical protein
LQHRFLGIAHISQNGNGADAAFDDHIRRATNHDEVFDIVTTHENKPAPCVDSGRIENLQAGLTIFSTANEGRGAATSANEPQNNRQSQKCHADTYDSNNQVVAVSADKIVHHLSSPFGISRANDCRIRIFERVCGEKTIFLRQAQVLSTPGHQFDPSFHIPARIHVAKVPRKASYRAKCSAFAVYWQRFMRGGAF